MIQFRRLTAFLLGGWLAASLFFDVTAVQYARQANRLVNAPDIPTAQQIGALGKENARRLLQHSANEMTRWVRELWEWTQLGLGLGLLLVLVFGGSRPSKVLIGLCLLMIVIVLGQRFGLSPQVARMGRATEYQAASGQGAGARWLGMGRTLTVICEAGKIAIGLIAAGVLLIRRSPETESLAQESEPARMRTSRGPAA